LIFAPVAEIGEPSYLIGQASYVVRGVIISAAGIDGNAWAPFLRSAGAVTQEPVEGQAGDLRRGVPERHIEGADGDAPLAVAARLFAGHHHLPGAERV
jgi:hypothetical protein